MEDHLRNLDERVSVLSAVDGDAAKTRIANTFGSVRMAIIYRGIQAGLTQREIAKALRDRRLPGAQQARVSNAFDELEELGFIRRPPKGKAVPVGGWDDFGLERTLKKTIRDAGVTELS
jgi:hypothetical protein